MDSATDSSNDSDYQEQQENELLTFEQFLGINSPLKSNQRNVTDKSYYDLRNYYVMKSGHDEWYRFYRFSRSELGLKGRGMCVLSF